MPAVANARHTMNGKRLSSATESSIGAVAASFPPDVARWYDVSATDRCIQPKPVVHYGTSDRREETYAICIGIC